MLTKADFQNALINGIADFERIAPLYYAGDPRILQQLDAIATMLAMLSSQVEVAMTEPFEKVRDSTVLADAALRGIVRKGSPARVQLRMTNKGLFDVSIDSGRVLIDSEGREYGVETPAFLLPAETKTIEAVQRKEVIITHTVQNSVPFYAIPIPAAENDDFLCGVAVSDQDGQLSYRDHYVNSFAGDRIFHVESDDQSRVYVRLGFDGVVGVAPKDGDLLTLSIFYTAGKIAPAFDSPFVLEYLANPNEAAIELKMDALLEEGKAPVSMAVLRDLARYPSVYDENAVFLGEFDFLVRRNFYDLTFLSVWNESAEERARGASVSNINVLFVACFLEAEITQIEADAALPIAPIVIAENDLTDTQKAIRKTILSADDSYQVRFITPVISTIGMTIAATIATSYIASDVRLKIIEILLQEFGANSKSSKRGNTKPLYQRVYALLKAKIPALSGNGSDFTLEIDNPPALENRPEMWRYVSVDSLDVVVETANIVTPSWG